MAVPADRAVGAAAPTWKSLGEAFMVCRQRVVLRRTVRIALLVGTILSIVNQGGVILGGDATVATWLRVLANYVIPFCVSNAGVLSATRAAPTAEPPPRKATEWWDRRSGNV
jgi:hypothetical protein